jgi:uncharacterized Fe-S cluster protein YjdI
MARRLQTYANDAIEVTFDPNICIHSARCLQSLPEVFDVGRRQWIDLGAVPADEIVTAVRRCPSGALQYRLLDGGPAEAPPEPVVRPQVDGPLYVRGTITIRDAEGGVIAQGTRFALCRCGGSKNKPFCDNTHRRNGFRSE